MHKKERRVFLSYASRDKDFANQLGKLLSKRGFSVFSDDNIRWGEVWTDVLRKEIEDATALILLIPTSDVVNRNNLWFEAGAAKALGKPVLAVLPPHHRARRTELPTHIANLLVLDADQRPLESIADMLSQALPEGGDWKASID